MGYTFESLQNFFMSAIEHNNVEIFGVIVGIGNDKYDPRADGGWPLRVASQKGHIEIVKMLLQDTRVNPADHDNSAVKNASAYGHIEVVNVLLNDSRVNPAAGCNYAIRSASSNGHIEVVKTLLQDVRVNPADCDNYAIKEALTNGHLEVVKLLIEDSRINIHFNDYWLSKKLVDGGNFELLLNCTRFDINFCDNYAIKHCWKNMNMEMLKKVSLDPRTVIHSEELKSQIMTCLNPPKINSISDFNLADIIDYMKKEGIVGINICSQTGETTFTKKC